MAEASLDKLLSDVKAATGSDRDLDRVIFMALGGGDGEAPPYTSSVDACIDLVHRALPGWGWHVGFGPRGIVPYASLHKDETRFEASAPTVPLALLAAALAARRRGA